MAYRQSFGARLITSVFLAVCYFVVAIGIWTITQDNIAIGAHATTGGSLMLNLILAALLSLGTAYLFLRRR